MLPRANPAPLLEVASERPSLRFGVCPIGGKLGIVRIEVIVGSGMGDGHQAFNRNLLLGCGSLTLFLGICLGAILMLSLIRDRQSAQYPGALPMASHSNYRGLPYQYRWDDTYITSDNFTAVYNWYSVTFALGAEVRAIGRCTSLEGTNDQLVVKRHMSATLCNTPDGQMIFVTRSTSLR